MSSTNANRPVALLIEDRPDLLRARQNLFNISGFQAICVSSARDALREFVATPAVDIVIADLNLDSADPQDLSGVDVANAIHAMRPELPIVAVSGQVTALHDDQKHAFTDTLMKGGALNRVDFDAKLEQWRLNAIAYQEHRALCGKRAVEALEAHADFQPVDFEVIREFLPWRQDPEPRREDRGALASPEQVLRDAGWWLQLIQSGKTVASEVARDRRTRLAILVWVRKEEADHLAVLQGFSAVTYRAGTADDAVEGLIKIIAGYHTGALPMEHAIGETERPRLRAHLDAVFG